MSGTPWRRDDFGLQDLEAPFSRADDPIRALSHVDRQERDNARGSYGGGAISSWRVVGPGSASGRHLVSPPGQSDQVVELPGPPGAFRPGSYVMVGADRNGAAVLGVPPAALVGASGFALDSPPLGVVEDYKIVSVESDDIVAGASNAPLTVRGYGLRGDETFRAVVYDPLTRTWSTDPLVTVHSPSNVDDTETTVLADFAAGVPPTYRINIESVRS